MNPQDIYDQVKRDWMAANGKHVTLLDRLSAALPLLLGIVWFSFFILSAAHTITMVNKFAHGVGAAAAVGFEVGLIVMAYLIFISKKRGERVSLWWYALEVIIFVMVVGANLGGSIAAIMETTNISNLSYQAIVQGFGGLSLTDQIGLALAVIFALSVPIGNVVIGQAVAHLILDVEDHGTPLEAKWKRVSYELLYQAFFSKAIENKIQPDRAALVASKMAAGFTGTARPKQVQAPVEVSIPGPVQSPMERLLTAPMAPEIAMASAMESVENVHSVSLGKSIPNGKRNPNGYQDALAAYREGKTVAQVIGEGIAGKSTAYNAWNEFKEAK